MQRHRRDGRFGEAPCRADVQRVGARQPVEVLHAFGRGDAGQPVDRRAARVHRTVVADRPEAFELAVNESGQNHERCAGFQANGTVSVERTASAAIRPCARASRRGRTCSRRSRSSTALRSPATIGTLHPTQTGDPLAPTAMISRAIDVAARVSTRPFWMFGRCAARSARPTSRERSGRLDAHRTLRTNLRTFEPRTNPAPPNRRTPEPT